MTLSCSDMTECGLGLAGAGLPLLVTRDISEQAVHTGNEYLNLCWCRLEHKGGDELPSAGFPHSVALHVAF